VQNHQGTKFKEVKHSVFEGIKLWATFWLSVSQFVPPLFHMTATFPNKDAFSNNHNLLQFLPRVSVSFKLPTSLVVHFAKTSQQAVYYEMNACMFVKSC